MQNTRLFLVFLFISLSVVLCAEWHVSTSEDEMTGDVSAFAISSRVSPTKQMKFPYNDVEAWIGIGSDGDNEWVYIGFTSTPNLSEAKTEDGYNKYTTRIKWDDDVERCTFIQEWGSDTLHFMFSEIIIDMIAKSSFVLVEIEWYGQGSVYFKFPLDGSAKAIHEMRSKTK